MFYRIVHSVLKPLTHAVYRPTIEGIDNVPRSGPVILASNHLSFIDSFVIPLAAPRQVAFLAKAEYFTGTGVSGTIRRELFEAVGAIPVDRDSSRAAQQSLQAQLDVLRAGGATGIYPEGTRSRDGRLYKGKTGVAWLALEARCPIVPVGLLGTEQIQPVGASLPRLAKVVVRFGTPIQVGDRFDDVPAGRARRELTDEVMTAIQALTGQEPAGVANDRSTQ
ncbi:lysophospholipid acyltransferase family protein [Arsenicicoccus sp. oral taxon 190]|uniref:lysophospholipid acyltransferase family protein n=1 Tax=Arsenicicoccus sp. oral taxon 190 TaxID=1658671 RepID=UPI00067A0A0B|nr:lysophospholipid acyltransferase family protein [Arsenicicoccus sp. oral taxon 190]AKT50489.1 acyl-phosphate glycerol 3-phosphate acyltransferase [Arsenicicoccus sp. oral taxon 190]